MPRAPQLLIVADDLSGALETGAVFAATGLRTIVVPGVGPGGTPAARAAAAFDRSPRCDVLVVDTASRHLAAAVAGRRVRAVTSEGRRRGVPFLYKKTDSTLRGHLGAELAAFRDAAGAALLPFAPAYPRAGRTTRRGHQHVGGVPLARTAFARDRLGAVASGSIATLLAAQAGLRTWVVPASGRQPRRGAALLAGLPAAAEGIIVFDAEDDADLRRAAARMAAAGLLGATAGSGGLAAILADTLDLQPRRARARARPARRGRPLLVVSGSRHPVAAAQLAAAAAGGFHGVPAPAATLAGRSHTGRSALVREAAARLAGGEDVILHARGARGASRRSELADARAVARGLGRLVHGIVARTPVAAVLASGGDTLAGVVGACGWTRLAAERELMTGVALAATGDRRAPLVVGKAGGFGGPLAWVELRDRLGRRP